MYNNNSLDQNKFFYQDFTDLQKLTTRLVKVIINISDDSSKNKKYVGLAKFLVQRINSWKPTPSFPIYLEDIPIEVKREIMQLAEPELHVVMNNLIDRIFKYSLQKEKVFNYSYFVKEIRNNGLLKWKLI